MMKLLLSLLFIGCLTAGAQTIPNASFENWTNDGTTSGDSLNGWQTSERVARNYGGVNSVFKGADPQDGNFSIHLKNIQAGIIKGNGVATNGTITLNSATFTLNYAGGTPDTSRSRFFSYWFKYDNSNNTADRGVVSIFKLRSNISGIPDTVAIGIDSINTASSYTFKAVPMIYRDYVNQPEYTLIILQSSRYARSILQANSDPNLGLNNELVIDSINFSGWVGIDDVNNIIKGVKVYPQPANDVMNLSVELNKSLNLSYSIYDISGKLIETKEMGSLEERINVSSLSSGRYLLKLTDENGVAIYSTPVSISK